MVTLRGTRATYRSWKSGPHHHRLFDIHFPRSGTGSLHRHPHPLIRHLRLILLMVIDELYIWDIS